MKSRALEYLKILDLQGFGVNGADRKDIITYFVGWSNYLEKRCSTLVRT